MSTNVLSVLQCLILEIQQCFVVFDVLLINDKNLANCPLHERVEHLKKLASVPHCSVVIVICKLLQDIYTG